MDAPEIMCKENKCLMRTRCHRFRATPTKDQKYFEKSPLWNDECNFFLGVEGKTPQEQRESEHEQAAEQFRETRPY